MKSTLVLTIAIFLLSAPGPDSKTISEVSAGFLSQTENHDLLASYVQQKSPAVPYLSTSPRDHAVTEEDGQIAE
jgi:hypothetical protein